MGACFNYEIFPGNLSKSELEKEYKSYRNDLYENYGTDAYNGTLSTCQEGLVVLDSLFDSLKEASDYVAAHHQKWESALAVKYYKQITKTLKAPTFQSRPLEYYSGYYFDEDSEIARNDGTIEYRRIAVNSFELNNCMLVTECVLAAVDGDQYKVLPADQLSEAVKASVKKTVNEYIGYRKLHSKFYREVQRYAAAASSISLFANKNAPLDKDFWSKFRKARAEAVKYGTKVAKLGQKIKDFEEKFRPKLYATKTETDGVEWLVGGWCSE